MIESRACSCRVTGQRLGCSHAVLFSPQCSQTSACVWHRARHGGALASGASDMWDNPCNSLPLLFCGLPHLKNQHLTASNKRRRFRVVHIDVAVAWRSEEAGFKDLSCKTRISLFRDILRTASSHSANDIHAVLCRSFTHFAPCWYEFLVRLSMMMIASLNCNGFLSFSVFVVGRPIKTMRWQADARCPRVAAPRRRLVGRVLFLAARGAQPSERTRGRVGQPLISHSRSCHDTSCSE